MTAWTACGCSPGSLSCHPAERFSSHAATVERDSTKLWAVTGKRDLMLCPALTVGMESKSTIGIRMSLFNHALTALEGNPP